MPAVNFLLGTSTIHTSEFILIVFLRYKTNYMYFLR